MKILFGALGALLSIYAPTVFAGEYDGTFTGPMSDGVLSGGALPRGVPGCPGNGSAVTLVVADNKVRNAKDLDASHVMLIDRDGVFKGTFPSGRVPGSTVTTSGKIAGDSIVNGTIVATGSFTCSYAFTAKRQ